MGQNEVETSFLLTVTTRYSAVKRSLLTVTKVGVHSSHSGRSLWMPAFAGMTDRKGLLN